MDILISFSWGCFYPMQHEARRILRHLGDKHPHIEWSSVEGIAVAHTTLDNRAVIRQCRQLLHDGEEKFEHAVKWLPVDYWCKTELDAIKQVIEQQVVARIAPRERWGMVVKKRRWQRYHTAEIIAYLAPAIDRPVDLAHPDKLVWIDVLGRQTAIAVLKPGEIFSVILEGG